MIVTFIGHRDVLDSESVGSWVRQSILGLGDKRLTFYCGGYGDFDRLCAMVCKDLKSVMPESELVLVTPYIDRVPMDDFYDIILYPPLESVPKRLCILRRNFYMIEKADVVIAYVRRSYGGAYKALLYAKRLGKTILAFDDATEEKKKAIY